MAYDIRYRSRATQFLPALPDGVKWLIIANVAVYLVDFFGSLIGGENIFRSLELVPGSVVRGALWQPVTYLFLHSLTSFWHILFNMLSLWMFGTPIEQTWGTKRFLQFYFVCGVGAGLCVVIANILFGDPYQRVIGASGAIYGLLLAYGMLFPEQTVLFSFLFPIKAKYMVMIFGVIAFMSSFQSGSTVSNLAHLGGMLFGYLYMKTQFSAPRRVVYGGAYARTAPSIRVGLPIRVRIQNWWRDYKLQRARKKFKVYMRNQDRKGPWTN